MEGETLSRSCDSWNNLIMNRITEIIKKTLTKEGRRIENNKKILYHSIEKAYSDIVNENWETVRKPA